MRLRTTMFFWIAWAMAQSCVVAQDEAKKDDAKKPEQADRSALEKQFAKTLTGAVFVGRFSILGDKDEGTLKEERYTIRSASKLKGDWWLITARVKYGTRDITAPIPVQVKWAGDTPIITLTDMKIPLLGTYTARVIVYRDKYAGTWSGGGHGGHLFGKIEREKPKPAEKTEAAGKE